MKEKIFNTYGIITDTIEIIDDDNYVIKSNNKTYVYIRIVNNIDIKNNIFIANVLEKNSLISCYKFIPCLNGSYINDSYVLLDTNNTNKEIIGLDGVIKFGEKKYYLDKISINWGEEWQNRIDEIELMVSRKEINNHEVLLVLNYYIGMAENAIELYNQVKNDIKKEYVPAHSVNAISKEYNIYNSLGFIWNYEPFDLAEIIKKDINGKKFNITDIDYIIKIKKWSTTMWILFFSRLLYNNYVFDNIDLIISEDIAFINKVLDNIYNYQEAIKKISKSLSSKKLIPILGWLNL